MTDKDVLDLENIKTKHKFANLMVSALCKPKGTVGARDWVMSIPARPTYDPDLVIGDSLSDIPKLIQEVERLRGWIEQYKKMQEGDYKIKKIESLTKELDEVRGELKEFKLNRGKVIAANDTLKQINTILKSKLEETVSLNDYEKLEAQLEVAEKERDEYFNKAEYWCKEQEQIQNEFDDLKRQLREWSVDHREISVEKEELAAKYRELKAKVKAKCDHLTWEVLDNGYSKCKFCGIEIEFSQVDCTGGDSKGGDE